MAGADQGRTAANASPRRADRSVLVGLAVSLRPEQWTKNLIVFAALIFGQRLFDMAAAGRSVAAFAIFCALSSAVYLVNDVGDRAADRLHPHKRRRPIAAGDVSPTTAIGVAVGLAAIALWAAFSLAAAFGWIAITYLFLFVAYTQLLKHLVIVDVLTIAIGFVLRAAAGAAVVAVPVSQWLLVCTILGALFLGLSKRRHELTLLADGAGQHRPILEEYNPYLLDQMIGVVTASTLVAYLIYCTSPETIAKFGTSNLVLTTPFAIYGILRYLYLVHRKGAGSPSDVLLTDRPLVASIVLWGLAVVAIIYRPFGLSLME